MNYAYQPKNPAIAASARANDQNISFKDAGMVCRAIRGRNAERALEFLEQAANGDKAIYYSRHCKKLGHRHELNGRRGRYPVKSCKAVLSVLENALANADHKNLGEVKVVHAVANKQNTYPRIAPKGRRFRMDYETTFIEIVVEKLERQAGAPEGKGSKAAEKKIAKKAAKGAEKKGETPVSKPASVGSAAPVEKKSAPASAATAAKPVEKNISEKKSTPASVSVPA